MHARSLLIALACGGCVGTTASEPPVVAYLRERREYADARGWELPHGRAARHEIDMIFYDCERGENAAASDLQAGIYGVAHFGLPLDCHSRYAYEAWQRYDVQHHWMGCVIDEHNAPYASCYNHVMRRAMEDAYGPGVLEDLRTEICERTTPRGSD